MDSIKTNWLIPPNIHDDGLKTSLNGMNEKGETIDLKIIKERSITLFLNAQEIVTNMTIGDYPEYLAIGYLANQHMLGQDEIITDIDYDDELGIVVVRTNQTSNYEEKLKKKIRTSGCAQGTMFGDVMEAFKAKSFDLTPHQALTQSYLQSLLKTINIEPSLYLEVGAIHGCVLANHETPLIYMEDVGRHNAVDKIAGYMRRHDMDANDKILYTTGRLTSEMVIKCVMMGIPYLVSRSGFTAFGVDLAKQANLTLIGRARGARFMVLSGHERILLNQ